MIKENTVAFRIDVSIYNSHTVAWGLKPTNHISYNWIPHYIADQIWLLFEFKDLQDKQNYLDNLQPIKSTQEEDYIPQKHFLHTEEWFTQETINEYSKTEKQRYQKSQNN